ncbi:hypothetical protein BH09ACT8_BH09ACT8_19430 [soil metagenome]
MKSAFERADQDQLAHKADDLMDRANLVLCHGWDQYRRVWSHGEVIGAALVLDDDAQLHRCSETTVSALERWAFDLWGMTGGQIDTDAGSPRTRAWFHSIRAGMGVPFAHQPPATR